jgi:exopolysaccharide biosynthesis polyprenyl glycosylphosphotransferase
LKLLVGRWRGRMGFHKPRILLISSSEKANEYFDLLNRDVSMAVEVIGLLTPSNGPTGSSSSGHPAPILGRPEDLPEILSRNVVDEVVTVLPIEHCDLNWVAASCVTRGLVMRMLVQVPQSRAGWHVNDCGHGSFFLSAAAVPQDALQIAAKRIFDIAGALAGLMLCGVVWVLCGWRLRCETGASVMFRQPRVGQNGRLFTLYKFRTMYRDAEQRLHELRVSNQMKGPMFKVKDDPRVTWTGRRLRRRHIDELPQFWNVLKGEMSLVGTRPPTQDEVAKYLDVHRRRLSMKPGLTGLWQLRGNDIVSDFEEVVKLDCQYIENWSLLLDLRIVLHTVRKMLRADAY